MKVTVKHFKEGWRICLSALSPTEVNRLRRVWEHAGRGEVWDGVKTRTTALEAANKASKALGVEPGEFFEGGEALQGESILPLADYLPTGKDFWALVTAHSEDE